MKFNIRGRMQSAPSITLDTHIDPLAFKLSMQGRFRGELGPFHASIGEFPVRMAIPFLKRRRPIIVTIGSIPLELGRFQFNLENAALDGSGVVGQEGIQATINAKIDCTTDMDLKGKATGRVGVSHLDLGDDEHDK